MFIKGVGMTPVSVENRSTYDLVAEAVTEALDDSDMSMNEINAVVCSSKDIVVNGERQKHSASVLSSIFKKEMPIIRIPAGCAGGGQALWAANNLEEYNNILVLGYERLLANTTGIITDEIMMGNERMYEQAEGLTFPATNALVAQEYIRKYNATTDDFAMVALKNHENGYNNPKARFYQKKVTMEQIKESPIIASPLRLFDCCPNANAAAACVISKDKSDVKIVGSASCSDYLSPIERDNLTTWDASVSSAKEAYSQSGLSPDDIDFVEVHDAFTPIELFSYEDLGFCRKGEGKNFIRDGVTALDGKLPVNPCGGLKSKGHPISATGMLQVYEIAKQMRKEAGNRQLSNVNTALAQNIGGAGSMVAVHVFKRWSG